MSLYYKKKLISGVRDVPSMTLAEYNALTNKPKLWIRTDAPDSDRGINADDIQYDSDTSVKEKIDSPIDIKETQPATAVLSVNGTMQLNSDIMGCNVIILTVTRYGYGDTKVFPISRITEGAYTEGCMFWANNENGWLLKISTTGLITYRAQVGASGEPFVIAYGI